MDTGKLSTSYFISSLITEIFQPGFCLRELESVLVNNLHAFLTGEKD